LLHENKKNHNQIKIIEWAINNKHKKQKKTKNKTKKTKTLPLPKNPSG